MFRCYKGGFRLTDKITFRECPTIVSIWTLQHLDLISIFQTYKFFVLKTLSVVILLKFNLSSLV